MVLAILIAPLPATAQDIPEEIFEFLTQAARENITEARISDGTFVPPETAEELALPIVPRELEVMVIQTGLVSGHLSYCRLEWEQSSFLRMTSELRRLGWQGKEMAYIGFLHGITQEFTETAQRQGGVVCDSDRVTILQSEINAPLPPFPTPESMQQKD